jgi:predicted nucleic acid-binding protein
VVKRFFVDTPVLLYAIGGPHELRDPCRQIVAAAARGRVELHASIEAIQEVLFHRLRRTNRRDAVAAARDYLDLVVCRPLDAAVMRRSFLLTLAGRIRGRDALHAATALAGGFSAIVTTDSDFSDTSGLSVLTPWALAELLEAGSP